MLTTVCLLGKIIFMAPTRPLVNQQMKACSDIMCLPSEDTTYLEGSISPERRIALWSENRVIFCTPQTAYNDLKEQRIDPNSIVCVVIDEAHKATGGYAYTMFMELLSQYHEQFRVLALSATPGSDVKKIQNVNQLQSVFLLFLFAYFLCVILGIIQFKDITY